MLLIHYPIQKVKILYLFFVLNFFFFVLYYMAVGSANGTVGHKKIKVVIKYFFEIFDKIYEIITGEEYSMNRLFIKKMLKHLKYALMAAVC